MTRFAPLAGVCATLLLLSPQLLAYGTQAQRPSSARRAAPDSSDPELAESQQKQQAALAGGDPATVARTSQALIDLLRTRANRQGLAPEPSRPATQMPATRSNGPQLASELSDAYNDLGTAEARQGQFDLALGHFQEAERWQPPTPVLLLNLGTAAFRLGDFKESARALTAYDQTRLGATSADPQYGRAHIMLGMSLFSEGQFAEAAKAFSAVAQLTEADPRAAYSWAFSLARSGQQQQANHIADELSRQSLPPEVMSLVCHLYVDTENYEQSVTCYRKAYQADPTLKLAHYQAGESLIRLDRPADAIPELRQELALSPENPEVQYSLAFALLQTSQKEEAVPLLASLTAAHPEHAQAQYQLGKALLEAGKPVDAITHLEAAEQHDSQSDYIRYQLQAAYRRAGRTEDADRELKAYRELKAQNRQATSPH